MMTKLRKGSANHRLLAWVMSLLVTLLSLPAAAGMVQIRDSGGLLTSSEASALRADAAAYPFDVRIVTSSEFDKKSDFDRYVGAQVAEPNMVVVGVDKVHRYTSVHFGTAVGVPPAQYRAVEQAGNPHFREGNWRAGIEAILTQAKEHTRAPRGRADSVAAPEKKSLAGSTLFIGLVVVMVVAAIVVFVGSVLSKRAAAGSLGPYGDPTAPRGPFPPGGPYPPGAYPPGPHPPGYGPGYRGGSGIGANIASAGLGGLVGYQLGKMASGHQGEHPQGSAADMSGTGENDDYDAGGSTGGWDDEGGGGDWGGGDGGDFGGGGDMGGGDW